MDVMCGKKLKYIVVHRFKWRGFPSSLEVVPTRKRTKKKKKKIDWLIDFNGMPTSLVLFYA